MKSIGVLIGALALLTLVLVQPVQAGDIGFQAVLTALPPYDPVPPFFIVIAADALQLSGSATSISGFNSLVGVNPADLTFTVTGLKFDASASSASFPISGTTGTSTYHGSPGTPALLDFFLSGTPIAEFTGLVVTSHDDFSMFFSSSVVTTTAEGKGTLDGLYTSTFSQEVLNQSGGQLHIQVDPFNSATPNLPASFSVTGTFAVVPEPGSSTLVSLSAVGLLAYGWRRRSRVA